MASESAHAKQGVGDSVWVLLSAVWRYAEGNRHLFVLNVVLQVLANGVWLLAPLATAHLVTVISGGGETVLTDALWAVGILFAVSVVAWVFHGPARVVERVLAFRVRKTFYEKDFRRVLLLPASWHAVHHTGDTTSRIVKADDALFSFTQDQFMYIGTVMNFVMPLGILVWLFPEVGVVLVGMIALGAFVLTRFDRVLMALEHSMNEKMHALSAVRADYISNIQTVLTLKLQRSAYALIGMRLDAVFPAFFKRVWLNEVKWFSADVVRSVVQYGVLLLYIWVHRDNIPLGGVVALHGYLGTFTGSLQSVAWQWESIVSYATSVRGLTVLYEAEPVPQLRGGGRTPWKELRLEGVSVQHGANDTLPALHEVGITVKRGQRIALVGSSGSGKTTLMAVLAGIVAAKSGAVFLDGKRVSMERIARMALLVPQEVELFDGTIAYNVTAGRVVPAALVTRAMEDAVFHEVVAKLPKGVDTHIFEKGVNLSGGQKQRLALARGMLAAERSEIVLCDEPTSSVDPVNERRVYENLFRRFRGRTVISSLHRVQLLPLFEYVYVLERGRVVEEGTPQELMKKAGGRVSLALSAVRG